ncbi:MAG TPA: undecaprenyl diphosphate synthase family protein, partial [Bacteroidia bacterium]|nr:undecaprenyl diphosphate synthase family protein [Bacteroidia bacterium]
MYAFSSDNWQRPQREVRLLMRLFQRYLYRESASLVENGVTLRVVGRRDRLAPELVAAIERAEAVTSGGLE